jgi:EAL domain-containing protein (putative c-di-GMP-specific phosphodiesterase class I)
MVRSIAQLARTMSITTVAEYVETREICARVAMLGVDYGQGFAIGRPTPLTDLLAGLPPLTQYNPHASAAEPSPVAETKRALSGA